MRTATVVLTDETGFDPNDLAQLAPTFTGIVPESVSVPAITLSGDSKTATLVYTLDPPVGGAWPDDAEGQIVFAAGAFEDAANNGSAAITETFIINPFLTPTISLSGDTDATEGGTASYDVTLSQIPGSEVTVTVDVTAGTIDPASLPADAALTSGGTQVILTFADGTTDLTQTFTVDIVDDTLPELDETFNVSIASTVPITTSSVTTTISANDGPVDSFNGVNAPGGDFSDDGLAPTDIGALTLQPGTNTLVATQQGDGEPGGRDRDYVTFTVPVNMVLSELILANYDAGETGFPQGFIAIDDGTQITLDPTTVTGGAVDLLGGHVYNSGDVNNDILDDLGDGESFGTTFDSFTPPLTAGTYTLWMNQGGESSQIELEFVVNPVQGALIAIGDAPTLAESGDTGSVTLLFPLTSNVADATVTEIAYTVDGVAATAQNITFINGQATLAIEVPNDDAYTLDPVTVVLTGVTGTDVVLDQTPGATTATGLVTEDDLISATDIDGDGILNTDDPFAYDETNGGSQELLPGGEFTQDFNTDTTDPFSPEGGFSGILVNPAFDYPDASETDPYGDRTSGDPTVNISNGSLNVPSSNFDAFPLSGTGANNTLKDGYQSGADDSGVDTFEVHALASSADWFTQVGATTGFEQFGITVGAGGVDDFVKLVVSDANNEPPRVQIAHNNSLVGGEKNYPFGTTGPSVDLSLVGDIEFRLIIDKVTATVTGQVDFYAAANPATLLESYTTPPAEILAGSSFESALNGQNPLTNGDGGVAYGVFVSDWGGSGGAAVNQITASYDFLTIRALDDVAADTIISISGGAAVESGDTDTTDVVFTLTASDSVLDGDVDLSISIDGGAATAQPVTFTGGAATLSVPVANDDLANGSETVEVALVSVTTPGFDIDSGAGLATIFVIVDDFAQVAVADTLTTPFDTSITFDPAANDTDGDDLTGDLTVSAIDTTGVPADVTVALVNGDVTVTPTNGFTGDVTFGYTVADPGGNTDTTGTATVTVAAATNTTIAIAGGIAVETGDSDTTVVEFTLSASDIALDGDVELSISVDGGAATPQTVTFTGGAATLSVPVANDDLANGSETVEVALLSVTTPGFDIDAGAGVATIDVTEDDFAPVAISDTLTTPLDTALTFNPAANDTDGDDLTGDLTVSTINTTGVPADVTVALVNGEVTVTPTNGFTGDVTFGYTVADPGGNTDITGTATVTVASSSDTLLSISGAPVVESGDIGFTSATFTLNASDTSLSGAVALSVSIDGGFTTIPQAVIFINGVATLSFLFANDDLANGPEAIEITLVSVTTPGFVIDAGAATATVEVTEDDFAPVAVADTFTTPFDTSITFDPAANDTDGDNLTGDLTVSEIDTTGVPAGVTVALVNGEVTVTPNSFIGDVTFGYTVSDPSGNTDTTGTATVMVEGTTIAIAGGTAVESGDIGTTDAVFTLTASDSALNGDIDLSVSVDGGLPALQTVTFENGVATIAVPVANDDLANGPENVEMALVSVTTFGFAVDAAAAVATFDITEDDAQALSITIDPNSIAEDGLTATGTVTRNTGTDQELIVTLSSDDPSEATVPLTVTIPVGEVSASFDVTIVDDAILDGAQTATITAAASGFLSDTAALDVTDNDAPTTVLRIEAEDITNTTGYRLEGNSAASGGQMLSLVGFGGPETGTATFLFSGASGLYDVVLGTFDEKDGAASLTVQQDGNQIGDTILLDQNTTGSNAANNSTKVNKTVGTGLELFNGATITITGFEQANEHARFDFIEFTPFGGGNLTPPIAGDDDITTDEATAISGNVLANDIGTPTLSVIEVDGSTALGTQITLASGALLTLNGDGSFDYDPNGAFDLLNAGELGTDSFTYLASNGQGFSEATVTVTLNGIDDTTLSIAGASVVELDDTGTTDATFTLTASDSGLNGDIDLSTSTDGGLTTTAQTVTFTNGVATLIVPVVNDDLANGSEIVEMTLVSASGFGIDAGAASATVEVTEDDFAPEAVADVLLTTVDTAVTFNPADNDTDLDNDAADLVVTAVDNITVLATEATVEVLAGQVTVPPLNGFTGDVTFDYTVVDLAGNETIGTATVTVDGGPQDQVVLRINAFGPEVAAIDGGPVWQADNGAGSQYLTTSDNRGDAPPAGYAGTVAAIPAGVPESVLDNARSSNAPFNYNIPVADLGGAGSFRVNLYVAELFSGGQASAFRIFDASLEGSVPVAFDNITPGTAFGADVGVLSAEIEVTDGVLNIGLLQDAVDGVQNPIVNAIEIVRLGAPIADTEPPSAAIALTNPADADSALLVDITLGDASGIDETSLGANDLTLSIDGTPTAATVSFTGFADGVASYSIAAPVGGWANGAAVSVNLEDGAILDLASPANASLASSQSLAIDLGAGAEPTNAIEALAAQDDLDTSATYSNTDIGAAVLEIMAGSSNIQGSNFGANSFEVTNVGDKKISAVFIDASTALYQDSVFDPDGQGGDSTAKSWAVNNAGNTGGFVTGTGYFLPGQDPLPNNTGIGIASNGGFKGAMVKFNPNVADGFNSGETVGFSGDMDPNSIAGLTKASVDGTAIDSWDVGGISGHELIGSSFTVLFDDGTTATGYLNSDGSASGSQTIATQASSLLSAPSLIVNGVGAGGTGTYGVTQPTVIVSGTPGDVVRLTLSKGFDPVTSGAPSNIDQLVEDRLDRYDFKVNNSFDLQTQDVVIGANGTFDATGLFDYNTAVANNVQDGTFPGDDVAQIAFVAAVIDPGNDDLPLSEVSDPIILTNLGGPVQGAPNPGPSDGFFELQGSGNNVYFKIQIEDPNGGGGTNPGGKWNYLTAEDELGNQDNFQGDGYYLFGSETSTGIDNQVGTNELLEYTIFVPETDLGTYTFSFAVSRDGNRGDIPSDQQNDLWLNFKHAEDAGNGDIEEFLSGNGNNEAEPLNNGFIKVFGGPQNGNWGTTNSVDGAPGNFGAQIEITEAGLYTIQIDGRSQGFHVDYFELYKGSNPGGGAANSAFVTTGSQPVVLANAIPDQVFADGVTDIFNLPTGTFDDPNNDPITYQVTVTATNGSDVSGVTINPTTGQIAGLSTLDIDTYTVLVTAQTIDGIASDTFEVDIVNEVPNLVAIAATTPASEPNVDGVFTISLDAIATTDTIISYSVGGTATACTDYTALSGTVTITAGDTEALSSVPVLDDNDSEGNETVIVTLDAITQGDANVLFGATNAATLTLGDDDGPPPTGFTVEAESISNVTVYRLENDGDAEGGAMLTLGGGSGGETGTASFTFTGATGFYDVFLGAFDESDGSPAASLAVALDGTSIGTVVLDQDPGGNAASPDTKVELAVGQALITTGQTITVTGVESGGEQARFDFIRFAPDVPPVPTAFIVADANGEEAGTVPGQFTVSLSEAATSETVITYSVGGTATAGADYAALAGSVVIPVGQQSATIAVPVQQDSDTEGTETVVVTLTGVTGSDAVLGATTTATVFIADDEAPPLSTLTFEAEAADVITNYRTETIGAASGGTVLSLVGGSSNESGSAAFVFGDTPDELTGTYDIIIGTFDESDGLASFTVDLTDFETGITTEIGSWDLNASLGSGGPNANTLITPTVATNIGLTAGDILTVNGLENGFEHARLDYLQLTPVV
ncbi:MAG: beta strand repeat-containing protein [Leptolyngbyaceae cyanobacterium]